ncbi:MAG TPA: tetratricopeptide repeat protein [Anaeromyxobacteraceae bacterium]|nr:tetratricopeptide repeat protein [Anaeromyxobacteraceae bacterium]
MRSLTLALLLAAAPALAAPPPPTAEARAQKEQGDQRRKAGDAVGAVDAYLAAIDKHAQYPEAYEALGEVLYGQRKAADALQAFGVAVELDPGYALAWYNLGFAARKVGDLKRARAASEKYTALRPADPDGHYGYGEVLRGLGERDAAVREYQRFIELAAAVPAQAQWVERAKGYVKELQPAPAAGGEAGGMIGSYTGSDAVPNPNPNPSSVPVTPSSVPVTPSPTAVAAPYPRPSPAAVPAPQPLNSAAVIEKLGAGDRAYLAGEYRAALFAYQDAVHAEPTNPAALVKLARAYSALRHPEKAEEQLQLALQIDPVNADARKALEELKNPPKPPPQIVQVPDAPKAAPAAQPVQIVRVPQDPQPAPAAQPSHVYRLAPDQAAEQQPAAPPRDAGADRYQAQVQPVADRYQPQDPAPAGDRYAAPPPADRPSAAQHYKRGVGLIGQKDYVGAVEALDRAIDLDPRLAVAYAARGSARFGLGRHKEAALDYRQALDLDPRLATPLWGLAECYRILGDDRAADTYARYADSGAADARDDLRDLARKRARELGR